MKFCSFRSQIRPQTLLKRTPVEEFTPQMSKIRAWRSFLQCETHHYRGFRPWNVQTASVVLIFASPNAPLWRISPFKRQECERGAHFCIPKCTPIEEFAPWTTKVRAWCSFLRRQTHSYRGFRPWNVQNVSVVLISAFPNALLSQISPFGRPKCERRANFCIAKRTPQDFALAFLNTPLLRISLYGNPK